MTENVDAVGGGDDFSGLLPADGAYFIAEAGVNHDGDLDQARRLVDVAADAGADAVKFQTFDADRLVAPDAPKAAYQEETDDADSQYEMLRRLELPVSAHRRLIDHCEERGIQFLSTPFDTESADLLDELDRPAIKIGSGELDNLPLLRHVAGFGRPMLVSTGMGTLAEIETALDAIRDAGAPPVALFHCTSAYPAPLAEANLRAIRTMDEAFDVPVGYSDHTTAVETPAFAVAAGARLVEKHFTLDRTLPGPDHAASLEPDELDRSVSLVRDATTALGSAEKAPTATELSNRDVIRKSLHVTTAVREGERFTESNVSVVRPADGLPPADLDRVLGERAATDLDAGEPVTADAVATEDE
ncbi:N-acetylneuraminate synthase [Salinigranum salinum]|uniref:N-acetylneuraminate synthase n=1 Tax=Salinigranum salinum TaxID=1364937 RepID=UPI001260BCB3|nr:N-acetylneuraminate synthase [Salinigranum salinum]